MLLVSYLAVDMPSGTTKEPLLSLNSIASADYIKKLKLYFFEAHYEEARYSRFPITIIPSEEKIIVEYEEEVGFDEFMGPKFTWKQHAYHFSDCLASTLRMEYHNIVRNLELHFQNGYRVKSVNAAIKKAIGFLSDRYQDIENNYESTKYLSQFKHFFSDLAKLFSREYSAFLPKRPNPAFTALLSAKADSDIIDPPTLKIEIFDSIKQLRDTHGREIFCICNPEKAKRDFKNFLYANWDKMTGPILVNSWSNHISEAKYLISRLCFYTGVSDSLAEEKDLFRINGERVTAKSTYTAKTRMNSAKKSAKRHLDNIIARHLS
jgi:hypothetical protein